MTALLALLAKALGTVFLLVATIGVLRFKDPFQRMHAATKAGTVGAGLVLAGVAITKGSFDATLVALLTVVFLIATMPVAGHLLGRAAYISGAPLRSRSNALASILPRMAEPLETRLAQALGFGRQAAVVSAFAGLPPARPVFDGPPPPLKPELRPAPALAPVAEVLEPEPELKAESGREPEPAAAPEVPMEASGFAAVRFPVIGPDAGPLAARAWQLAVSREVPATGIAVIDATCVDSARTLLASDRIRACLATAVADTRRATGNGRVPFTLVYEEGDPLALIPSHDEAARELLLLPTDGWCHHGAHVTLPVFEDRMADKLFTLAELHAGPVLFAGTGVAEEERCIVVHDGSERSQALAEWALRCALWPLREVTVVGRAKPAQLEALASTADACGLGFEHLQKVNAPFTALLPRLHAGVTAVVIGELPQPARINAYGTFWQDRLIPGFRGDVLVA